jgi:hypothetical protein
MLIFLSVYFGCLSLSCGSRTAELNQRCGSLYPLFRDVELSTALGILHWLQVFDFDVLLFLSWHFSLPLLGCLLFLLCQWHRRAIDARP